MFNISVGGHHKVYESGGTGGSGELPARSIHEDRHVCLWVGSVGDCYKMCH